MLKIKVRNGMRWFRWRLSVLESILLDKKDKLKIISNSRHFKLIIWFLFTDIGPYTNFIPNRMKNTEVDNFRFWSIISPHTKFHPNPTEKLKMFTIGWFWLVGRLSKKKGCRHCKLILWFFGPLFFFIHYSF